MIKSIYIISLSLSLTLVGCGLQSVSKEKQIPVSGKIIVDNSEYEMKVGRYNWERENTKIRRIENFSPIKIAKDFETLKLQKNEKVKLVIEDNPDLTIYLWSEDGKSKGVKKQNYITVPSKSGYFIYEVVGKWSDGEASYIFDVEIN
ncbi:hypothetical protein [Gottfriedia acidiceleris]|uniref:hypothetical protein n=1 Tax=Gottfriedia acidiceleris TaxID=371036 RepID=UPI002FFF1809